MLRQFGIYFILIASLGNFQIMKLNIYEWSRATLSYTAEAFKCLIYCVWLKPRETTYTETTEETAVKSGHNNTTEKH